MDDHSSHIEPTLKLRHRMAPNVSPDTPESDVPSILPVTADFAPASADGWRPAHSLLEWLAVGSECFGFRLRYELGRGAFARVFLAEQADLAGRLVVLKFSTSEGTEPQTLATLQHTHIVPIHSVHENASSGLRAVCMPYLGGATLAQILDLLWNQPSPPTKGSELVDALRLTQTPVAPAGANPQGVTPLAWLHDQTYLRAVAGIIARLAEALQHAHQRGVIHSDIKPSNILLAADGQPLLLDFNVAKHANDPTHDTIGGTLAYAAPEQVASLTQPMFAPDQCDARADIYSLGLVFYKMVAGQHLFESTPTSNRVRVQTRTLTPDQCPRPDMPWSLHSILCKCLEVDPARRYQQAEHLAEDLRCFLKDEPLTHASELSKVERLRKWTRRHPRLTSSGSVAIAALLLLMAAGAAFIGVREHLDLAEQQLHLAQARSLRQAYEEGTQRALCLVNTVTDLPGLLPEGTRVCESTLALYGVLEKDDWQDQENWQCLSEAERRRLAEDTRELLLLLAWARVHARPGDDQAARDALTLLDRAEMLRDLPPSRALSWARSRYLERLGEHEAAQAARTRADQTPPAGAHDHYLLAVTYARLGTPEGLKKAIAELDRALKDNPLHYWALAQRGICRQEQGEWTLAAGDFSTCVGLWPEFAWGYFNRGYVLSRTGHPREALADFDAALQRDPQFVAAYLNRGLLRVEFKQHVGALADFDAALRLGRDDAFVHAGRGMALEGLGQTKEADATFAEAFRRAKSLPASARARIRWVHGFAVSHRGGELARKSFEEVLVDDPQQPQALYGLGQLAVEKNRLREALKYFDRAVDADPNFVDARRGRAIVHARLAQFELASTDINWCLEREPRRGVTLYAAACIAALAAEKLDDSRMRDQALMLLQKAFDDEYGKDRASVDADLHVLRSHPRFKQLCASR